MVVWYESVLSAPIYLIMWFLTGEIDDSINHMRGHLAQSIGYIAIGSAMAFLYSIAVMELIQVTSSLTSTVLGTAKHVTMTMAAALLVDHVIADGTP